MINRLIFWISLAGMILALHLWIQKARGFDQGCLGLSKPEMVESSGCRDVGMLPASHLLGVSNAAWGYAFYFALALISFGKIAARVEWARRLHRASEVLVGIALLYSVYLVLRMGLAHSWCVLCLASAGLVALLATLHVVQRARGGFEPVEESARGREVSLAGAALFAMTGSLVAVLLFVDRLGTRPLDQGSTRDELKGLATTALLEFIDPDKLAEIRACKPDWLAAPLDLTKFIGPSTPFLGKPDGTIVIAFSDPLCPACRRYHAEFLRAMEKYGGSARFTLLPAVLTNESILPAQALKIAETSGKYFELWHALLELRPEESRALTVPQVAAVFRQLGIDDSNLEQRLAAARPAVMAAQSNVRAGGVGAVPTVYIAGRKVWWFNRSAECLGKLLQIIPAELAKPMATQRRNRG